MPRKPEYTGVSLKEELAEAAEDFIKEHPRLGFRSLTAFVEDATRRRLDELKSQMKEPPRFEQVNLDENGTKVLDRQIKEVVQIYIKPSGIQCGLDQVSDCEHVCFALTLNNVKEAVRKRKREGWKLPDV